MANFLDKLIGRSGEDEYAEVDLAQFEEVRRSSEIVLRMAELLSLDSLTAIKQELYCGNILVVDIAGIKRDQTALDKAIDELRRAVDEVSGDIVGISEDLIIIVPGGVKIDRDRVVGGEE
jgi:uncharacterized protein